MNINLDIRNDVNYKHAKFYYVILCIASYTKISKSDKICRFEIYILKYTHLSFLCSQNQNI
jgi:hypothetical protein